MSFWDTPSGRQALRDRAMDRGPVYQAARIPPPQCPAGCTCRGRLDHAKVDAEARRMLEQHRDAGVAYAAVSGIYQSRVGQLLLAVDAGIPVVEAIQELREIHALDVRIDQLIQQRSEAGEHAGCGYSWAWHDGARCPTEAEARERSGAQ